jgi:hypothetical protein
MTENGTIEIDDVYFILRRKNGKNETQYKVKVLHIGKKVEKSGVFAEHSFHTSSPMTYLTNNTVDRQLYYGIVEETSEEIRGLVDEFLLQIQSKIDEKLENEKLAKFIFDLSEKTTNNIMKKLRLEEGDYILEIVVEYLPLDFISRIYERQKWGKNKKIESKISFKVANYNKLYETKILKHLFNRGLAQANPQGQFDTNSPEYIPYSITELK